MAKIETLGKKLVMRAPASSEEWQTYHEIRIAEIHNRYCIGLTYDYQDPEERKEGNFPFVLVDSSKGIPQVVGVIRVDILPGDEAALRWVAIPENFQGQKLGTRMVGLAEKFISEQGRKKVCVPAEEDSRVFYEKLGYNTFAWPEGPHNPGEISMLKELSDENTSPEKD